MKILSLFFALFVTAALVVSAETPAIISLSTAFSFLPEKETVENVSNVWFEHPVFGFFFSAKDYEKDELAGKLNFGSFAAVSFGSLQKSSALSRLTNPVISAYTSALGQLSLPVSGVASAVPHSPGNHPDALALRIDIPLFSGKSPVFTGPEIDVYASFDEAYGMSISAPLKLPSTTIRFTVSGYNYTLVPKKITSWYTDTLQFAPGEYTSFLLETAARIRFHKKLFTYYGAAGFAESPLGDYDPWFRMETGISAGILTVKGRIFYAPYDFYTPASRVIANRFRYAVNPFVNFPLVKRAGVLAGIGVAFVGDTSTELYTTRVSSRVSAGAFAVTFSAALANWYLENGEVLAGKDTSVPLQLTGNAIFPAVKTALSVGRKWYVDADWNEKKTEHTVSISLTPRLSKDDIAIPIEVIPAGSCKITVTTYPDGREKGTATAALKWNGKTKLLKFAARIGVDFLFLEKK